MVARTSPALAHCLKFTSEMMRADAGFHADQAWRHVGKACLWRPFPAFYCWWRQEHGRTIPLTDISLRPCLCAGSYHHSLNVGSAHPPQTQGKVQSAVSFALSGIYRLQTEALTGLIERQTTSKVPEELIPGGLRQMVIGIHHDLKAARRLDPLTINRLPDCVDVGGSSLGHGLNPRPKADKGGFHRVICGLVLGATKGSRAKSPCRSHRPGRPTAKSEGG